MIVVQKNRGSSPKETLDPGPNKLRFLLVLPPHTFSYILYTVSSSRELMGSDLMLIARGGLICSQTYLYNTLDTSFPNLFSCLLMCPKTFKDIRVGGKYTFFPKSKRDPKFDEFNPF